MISPLDSRILDKNSECLGISVETLMENAGKALAEVVDTFAIGKIIFICGSGNNGGDGYAASKYLKSKADYCAFKVPKSELCIKMSKDLEIKTYDASLLEKYDTIVDCVLGTGIEGELRPEYSQYIDKINKSNKNIIACDVPTGFGTSESIRANTTITFHDMKKGMDEHTCGRIIISDIGIPIDASVYVNKGDFLRYPIPKKDSHKGQNGRLIIVGGGPYVGAPACAGMAAVRIGADLVTIFTPKRSFIPIASISTSYIVKELSGDYLCTDDVPSILDACKNADALLIGPGIGCDEETAIATREIVSKVDLPIVIDADAITNVSVWNLPKKKSVFTPHSKELARIIDDSNFTDDFITEFCKDDYVILHKGPTDRIYSSEMIRLNRTGCVGMTVGGTGDVLAGIVAGLLSKHMSPFDSACLGAYICGLAGEKAFEEYSYGMSAEDVISHIGHVLKEGLK